MTASFVVRTTPKVDRLLKKLTKRHPDLPVRFAETMAILGEDPYNVTRSHPIKRLEGSKPGEGQYRLRLAGVFATTSLGKRLFFTTADCGEDTYR